MGRASVSAGTFLGRTLFFHAVHALLLLTGSHGAAVALELGLGTAMGMGQGAALDYRRHEGGNLDAQAHLLPKEAGAPLHLLLRSRIGEHSSLSLEAGYRSLHGEGAAYKRTHLGPFPVLVPLSGQLKIDQWTAQLAFLRHFPVGPTSTLKAGGGLYVTALDARAWVPLASTEGRAIGGLPMLTAVLDNNWSDHLSTFISAAYGELSVAPTHASWHRLNAGVRHGLDRNWSMEAGYQREALKISTSRKHWAGSSDLSFAGFFLTFVRHF